MCPGLKWYPRASIFFPAHWRAQHVAHGVGFSCHASLGMSLSCLSGNRKMPGQKGQWNRVHQRRWKILGWRSSWRGPMLARCSTTSWRNWCVTIRTTLFFHKTQWPPRPVDGSETTTRNLIFKEECNSSIWPGLEFSVVHWILGN